MESSPVPTVTPARGGVSSSPWGSVAPGVPTSFEDVMSEELAHKLQMEEDSKVTSSSQKEVDFSLLVNSQQDTSDDLLLAKMLQHEFDKEHDTVLKREEDKWNGDSKVKISFKNYRCVHPNEQSDDEEHQDNTDAYQEDTDEPVLNFSKKGISGKGKNIVTKHDSRICGKKNGMKVMNSFPPDFETGDGHKYKMQLPNHVYNKLKRHAENETKRSERVHEKKEFSTAEQAVDSNTRLILYKLVNSGLLESVEGVISSGKESVVFHGTGGNMSDHLVPRECAIKVFKTTLSEFKNRFQYVRGDVRFLRDEYKKWNSRKIIKIWAEKELANLKKMETSNIPCPRVVVLKKHVLVMSFLGDERVAAPKLKEAKLSVCDLQIAYEQCVENMMKMYNKAGLVHADLSEYNMMWWKDTLHFIDVAQAVDKMHPRAGEFLLRDCNNVTRFFNGAGVTGVASAHDLFNRITGLSLKGEGEEFLAQLEQYEKDEEKLRMDKGMDYPFDFFFNQAQVEREEHRKVEELFGDDDSDSEESSEGEEEDGTAEVPLKSSDVNATEGISDCSDAVNVDPCGFSSQSQAEQPPDTA